MNSLHALTFPNNLLVFLQVGIISAICNKRPQDIMRSIGNHRNIKTDEAWIQHADHAWLRTELTTAVHQLKGAQQQLLNNAWESFTTQLQH